MRWQNGENELKTRIFIKENIFISIIYFIVISLIVGFIIALLIINDVNYYNEASVIDKGSVQLTDQMLEKNQLVSLAGVWDFYPELFLSEYNPKYYSGDKRYVAVPGGWVNIADNGNKFSSNGFGTYHLKIINKSDYQDLQIYLPSSMIEAYTLYVDGVKKACVGKIGRSFTDSQPQYDSLIVDLPNTEEMDILIQVSSYHFNIGGIRRSILLGASTSIQNIGKYNFIKDVLVVGILLGFFLYFSFNMIMNKRNRNIYLCLIYASLTAIMYTVTSNEMVIMDLFPQISFRLQDIMQYMLAISGGTVLILMINEMFPDVGNIKIKKICVFKTIILVTMNVLLERQLITQFINLFSLITTVEFLYGIFMLCKASIRNKTEAFPLLFGTALLMSTISYDVMYVSMVIYSSYGLMTSVGIAVFIMAFAIVAAIQQERAFKEIETLSNELIVLNQVKDSFLANTSHELKTPINSIIAITKAIQKNKYIDHEIRELVDFMEESGVRLKFLISDLLDYSAIHSGNITMNMGRIFVNGIINHVVNELKELAAQKNINILLELSEEKLEIFADKYRFMQVLYNLIGNAIKFTDSGGRISIATCRKQKEIFIHIRDNGRGIHPEYIDKIFQSFEQGNIEALKKNEGLGLGLSISSEIIAKHKGRITVESELDVGSVFTITIPEAQKNDCEDIEVVDSLDDTYTYKIMNPIVSDRNRLYIKGSKKETIVIVDDYYVNLVAVASILKEDGYTIKGFTDAGEGLTEAMSNSEVITVLVDYMMPNLSGIEYCCAVREKKNLIDLPILVLTARTQMTSLIQSFESGANDFLFKPFEPEELRSRVRMLTDLKKTEEKAIENELGKLSAQINPHFISNALIAVSEFCYMNQEQAAELALDIAEYLRYIFTYDYKIKEIELSKELELVHTYLKIEKVRLENKLLYNFDIEDSMGVYLPPFSIQTLVENAVKHGIRKKREGGSITIKGYQQKMHYQIDVIDTGVGIMKEDIPLVLSGDKYSGFGIGLSYVNKSVKNLYGTEVTIESDNMSTTKVSFKVLCRGGLDA